MRASKPTQKAKIKHRLLLTPTHAISDGTTVIAGQVELTLCRYQMKITPPPTFSIVEVE